MAPWRSFAIGTVALGFFVAVLPREKSEGSDSPAPPSPPTETEAMNTETASASERAATVSNALGIRLLRGLSTDSAPANLCLSPYSIAAALAMTYPGSAGETRAQMRQALGFPMEPAALTGDFSALDAALLPTQEVPDVAILRANRLFGEEGTLFRPAFLQLLQKDFSAPLELTDFASSPQAAEAARQRINSWVGEQTREKIRDLLPSNSIDTDTRLVLVNALYFKAPWVEEFPAAATAPAPFRSLSGEEISVPFMRLTQRLGYAEREGFHVVSLAYRGIPYQMLLLLPVDAGAPTPAWPEQWGASQIAQMAQETALSTKRVQLSLPKFRIAPPTINLADQLAVMGMASAFDRPRGSANFDEMAPRLPDDYLFISGVFHKTFIEVDEKGTEAAAATAVAMMRATSIDMSEPVTVTFDRPFWFALQHRSSGVCLFLGRVGEP